MSVFMTALNVVINQKLNHGTNYFQYMQPCSRMHRTCFGCMCGHLLAELGSLRNREEEFPCIEMQERENRHAFKNWLIVSGQPLLHFSYLLHCNAGVSALALF